MTVKLTGAPMGSPWDSFEGDGSADWDFESAAHDSPEQVHALYDGKVARARTLLDAALADGRHTGHADLLREAVDGVVGEDPPPGWRPSGADRSS